MIFETSFFFFFKGFEVFLGFGFGFCLRNGGEDDEMAAVAASCDEEVRGETGSTRDGGLGSGAGRC